MISRRGLLKGFATTPLAMVLADPELARAQAAGLEMVTISLSNGKDVSGALAWPDKDRAGAVLLIHEWWGLNDQIKSVAAELAKQGYMALAADLYDGEVTGNPDRARALTQAVDPALATETLVTWIDWLRKHGNGNGKIATIGWCFGGGWSLNASIAAPVEATIIYYGRCNKSPEETAKLKGPVLGHFATQDVWINADMVSAFEKSMDASGKSYANFWYDANHGFANPTSARYDAADAAQAWSRTLTFLEKNLA